jgi:hypothetical protein
MMFTAESLFAQRFRWQQRGQAVRDLQAILGVPVDGVYQGATAVRHRDILEQRGLPLELAASAPAAGSAAATAASPAATAPASAAPAVPAVPAPPATAGGETPTAVPSEAQRPSPPESSPASAEAPPASPAAPDAPPPAAGDPPPSGGG